MPWDGTHNYRIDRDDILHITERSIRFPVLCETGGFGSIDVTLEPGEKETIEINGKHITVIRDYLQ